MPAFMSLMKAKGAKNANSLKEIEECITKAGGKWTGMYTVIGDYDYVCIFEIADEKAASSWIKDIDARGDVKTTILKNMTSVLAKSPRRG